MNYWLWVCFQLCLIYSAVWAVSLWCNGFKRPPIALHRSPFLALHYTLHLFPEHLNRAEEVTLQKMTISTLFGEELCSMAIVQSIAWDWVLHSEVLLVKRRHAFSPSNLQVYFLFLQDFLEEIHPESTGLAAPELYRWPACAHEIRCIDLPICSRYVCDAPPTELPGIWNSQKKMSNILEFHLYTISVRKKRTHQEKLGHMAALVLSEFLTMKAAHCIFCILCLVLKM